jgi:hypothetical protein
MKHIAIDPGASGGIAVRDHDGTVTTYKMPKEHSEIVHILRGHTGPNTTVIIEEVPKFCGRALPASSIFVMAQNHGVLIGAVLALGFTLRRVPPKEWQKSLGTSKKAHGDAWKRFLKARAQELFPEQDVTLATADALLMLDWARRNA